MLISAKFNPSTGADWCKKREHKLKIGAKGRTPGKTKGLTCQADSLQRYMAKCSRSYKHKLYGVWLTKTRLTSSK